jgi:hypothetical protein
MVGDLPSLEENSKGTKKPKTPKEPKEPKYRFGEFIKCY